MPYVSQALGNENPNGLGALLDDLSPSSSRSQKSKKKLVKQKTPLA